MANKTLFQSIMGEFVRPTDAQNSEGAPAYKFSPKQMLAQYVATGCMNDTCYATGQDQLATVLKLCTEVDPEFIARTALFCRSRGHMKDMPALLCAILSVRGPALLVEIFDRVIDSPKMLRNFVQIMRSGAVGRKSLGTLPKRLVETWLESRSDDSLFCGSVGQDPSLADIIRMVHPRPETASRKAMFGYLIGRPYIAADLPPIIQSYEVFKADQTAPMPEVPFQMLTSLKLSDAQWRAIAVSGSWQMTRMNLNTFARHNVFSCGQTTDAIARKLRAPELITKARVLPYQLMAAYMGIGPEVPAIVRDALQDAMETAIENVPAIDGHIYVCPDISRSMHSPITGVRAGGTTTVRCVDAAALITAAIVRKNPRSDVLAFETRVVPVDYNPRDAVLTNAAKFSSLPAGGTNCSAPLAELNRRSASGDLVIYVSDNESWIDSPHYGRFGGSRTETMNQWAIFKGRNPAAKMVCIDLQPNATTQSVERADILNIGGFSDQVFDVIAAFVAGTLTADHWVGVIDAVRL